MKTRTFFEGKRIFLQSGSLFPLIGSIVAVLRCGDKGQKSLLPFVLCILYQLLRTFFLPDLSHKFTLRNDFYKIITTLLWFHFSLCLHYNSLDPGTSEHSSTPPTKLLWLQPHGLNIIFKSTRYLRRKEYITEQGTKYLFINRE